MHRRNAAERAIRTYKNHLLAGLATCHPEFPLTEWDRLIDQCNITINLLRTSRINPNLSAYNYIYGNYDFNAHPLAPPGTKVVLHKKPDNRGSWQYHGVEAWYVGPSLNHYRCFKCFVPSTGATLDTDTVQLIPHLTPIPKFSDADALRQAIADIIYIIKHSKETDIPKFWKGDKIQQAFQNVADVLDRKQVTKLPTVIPPDHTTTTIINKKQKPEIPQTQPLSTNIQIVPPDSPKTIITSLPTPVPLPRVEPALPRVIPRAPFPKIWAPAPTHIWQPNLVVNHIFDDRGRKQSIDDLIKGPTKDTWLKSTANELGRLANGIPNRVRGTDCIVFIHKSQVPPGKKVTYANMVCDYRPLKDEPYRVRLTVGGDKLDYFGETASPTANLLETKLLINSVISDAHKGARFLGIDIKDFFSFIGVTIRSERVHANTLEIL